jgi:hypothetical protein
MSERDLERRAQRRLAVLRRVEEVSGNVAATCRYYGISRQCYSGGLRRFDADLRVTQLKTSRDSTRRATRQVVRRTTYEVVRGQQSGAVKPAGLGRWCSATGF